MFKLKKFIPNRVCLICDGCCRFSQKDSIWAPRLLNEEERLAKRIRLLSNPKQGNFICACLDIQDNRCKIYSLRPFECQLYPFIIRGEDKKIYLAVDLKCPFVKENLKGQKFEEYTQYLIGFLNKSSGLRILKNNPQIIQTYEGVLNLAELNFTL